MAKAKSPKHKVAFNYTAPEAQTVLLAGDFTNWQESPLAMKKGKTGVWTKTISLNAGRYQYRFLVDGQWQNDPACQVHEPNQFGTQNCVCVVNNAA